LARIALVNVPFRSHVAAILRLAGVLVRQGHEVIVWAPERWREQAEDLGAGFESHAPELPRAYGYRFAAELASMTERIAEPLISELFDHDVDLLIRDNQTPWALVAGQYLGIPRIVAHPMFPMFTAGHRDVADGESPPGPPDAEEEAQRARFEEIWLSIARRWGVELSDVGGIVHMTSEPTLTFTTEEIVGDEELPSTWHCIGPLLPPPPAPQLGRGRPLVYTSFGTTYNRRAELFQTVISGLTGEPVDVVISTGRGSVTPEDLAPLPPNFDVHDFVPTQEVLARASVHITHGGCNSAHESLLAGVPMVCLPQAFDQLPLSRRIEQLGVGLVSEEDPVEVRRSVRSLLRDPEAHRRARALSEHLLHYDGEARVGAAVAELG
jgi:MGT family glycosyltransferase